MKQTNQQIRSSRPAWKQKYLADRAFYVRVLQLVVPMILQAAITSFVSLLDNIMVGQIGTAQMSGVSIVNQYVFVANLTIFGAVSGPGIFGAQFYGKGDYEGQRATVRFRILVCLIAGAAAALLFALFDDPMITLFLSKEDAPRMVSATLAYGKEYMAVVLFSLIPFGIGQAYASVERECGNTHIPMLASFVALGVNFFLDYALIFGKCGMPKLGVAGAAIATVIAKIMEAMVMILWAHACPEKNKCMIGLYHGFYISSGLMREMTKKSLPLLFNEFMWAAGMTVIAQCYSVRGLDVVAARNIASTLNNMFNVVFIQMGAGIGIIVGQILGAGRLEEAKETNTRLYFFTMLISVLLCVCILPLAAVFPSIYNTEESVRSLAAFMIIIQAIAVPMWSYTNACYFTLRSGGKTGITFLFDFVFTWLIMIPLAFVLSYFTSMDIHMLFVLVTFSEMIKVFVGYFLVKSGTWMKTIVD
jgi:putative MATE family efflux protein